MFPQHTHLLQAFSCRTLRQLILKLSPDSFKCFHYFTDLIPMTPYKHLDEFIEICSTIRLQNFLEDALRMRLFPFSLKEKAKYLLTSLETNSITSWAQMQHEFLKKYFTIRKTNHIRKSITGFSQIEGEPFHETWERMKDLLQKCPHHVVPKCQLVQCFYDGLTEPRR
jgi:hypothetical protein